MWKRIKDKNCFKVIYLNYHKQANLNKINRTVRNFVANGFGIKYLCLY